MLAVGWRVDRWVWEGEGTAGFVLELEFVGTVIGSAPRNRYGAQLGAVTGFAIYRACMPLGSAVTLVRSERAYSWAGRCFVRHGP